MAHFPQTHSRVRAPRVRIPSNESVNFNLGGRKVSATLHQLSLTGGLAQFHDHVEELLLAEVVLTTVSGPVSALVEFLDPQIRGDFAPRPFRFIALDDSDFKRLAATLQAMRKQQM